MSRAKPTPGPWLVGDGPVNDCDGMRVRNFLVMDENNRVIMDATNSDVIEISTEGGTDPDDDIRHYDWQSLANARLMAAAPTMLEALEQIAALGSVVPLDVRNIVTRAIVIATTRNPNY